MPTVFTLHENDNGNEMMLNKDKISRRTADLVLGRANHVDRSVLCAETKLVLQLHVLEAAATRDLLICAHDSVHIVSCVECVDKVES